jgi:teichuronic acid biosynthesis glycosyltransferase TuaC
MNHWPDEHPDRLADLKLAVRQAGAVITVSGALADRVRTVLGVEAVHLPLGCDHRALAASAMPRSEARRLLDLPEHAVVVLMVGYLMPHKGVRALVDAILALGDPFLGVIVGEGTEFGYGSSDSRAAGHLQYAGQAPHERVAIYMSAADVLVLPSSTEGLPTVLVEAGSLGLPVIASSVGGIPELLGDDRGTLLSDVSAEAVASALAAFHAHRAEAEAAARRLRDHVLAAYDVDRNAARLLECYRSVAPGLDGP